MLLDGRGKPLAGTSLMPFLYCATVRRAVVLCCPFSLRGALRNGSIILGAGVSSAPGKSSAAAAIPGGIAGIAGPSFHLPPGVRPSPPRRRRRDAVRHLRPDRVHPRADPPRLRL